MPLEVNVVAPDRILWTGEATSVVAPTVEGEIGLRPGHEPVLSVLKPGRIRVFEVGGKERDVNVGGGFISFDHDAITIVADSVDADSVDAAGA